MKYPETRPGRRHGGRMSVRSATAAAILLLAAPLGATAYCEVESFLDEFTDEPHSVTFACTSDDGQAVWRMDYYVAEDSLLMSVYDPFNLPMLALDKLMKAELDAISRDEALEIRRVPLPDDTKGMLAEFWQHVRDSLSPLPDDDG